MLIKKFFEFLVSIWRLLWGVEMASPAIVNTSFDPDPVIIASRNVSQRGQGRILSKKVSRRRYGILGRNGGRFACSGRFVCCQ